MSSPFIAFHHNTCERHITYLGEVLPFSRSDCGVAQGFHFHVNVMHHTINQANYLSGLTE